MAMAARRGDVWAVIPAKPIACAKQRLASVLSDEKRRDLAFAMFHDVLVAAKAARFLGGALVVTRDPAVRDLAKVNGVRVIMEPKGANLNQALTLAQAALVSEGQRGVIIVPADVPALEPAEIDQAVRLLDTHKVVLAPAEQDGGTNLLGLAPPDLLRPQFGIESFVCHVAAARTAGHEPYICQLLSAARDIDRPDDLSHAASSLRPDTHTARLFAAWSTKA